MSIKENDDVDFNSFTEELDTCSDSDFEDPEDKRARYFRIDKLRGFIRKSQENHSSKIPMKSGKK